jgi:hypothetical protein
MRILICGDRNWTELGPIRELLKTLPNDTIVIHGNAQGADLAAAVMAEAYGLTIEAYPADWGRYGRAAGPIRNQQMLDEGQPEHVHAFHSNIDKSKGTKDMVKRARLAGIPVTIHT